MKVKNLKDLRQAITTKYLGPTTYRGSRVKAMCNARSKTLEWDSALNSEENHAKAAWHLFALFGWNEKNSLLGGALPNNKGYCFVQVPKGLK